MKISDLRPCDACGGSISPQFYVVRFSIAIFKPRETFLNAGMTLHFGLALAEALSPDPDVVTVAMDEPEYKKLMVELFLCQHCYMMEKFNLAVLAQKRVMEIEKQTEAIG